MAVALSGTLHAQISDGLVSYWPLDEIQGTKTPDLVSFYDMDVTNLEAGDVVAGRHGNAFSFDNARQTLLSRVHDAGDDLPANKHRSHTISMWVNVVGEGQNDLRIFSEGNTENSNPLFNIGTHNGGADGSVDFYLRQSGWSTFGHAYSEQQPFDGNWHHIAWVQEDGARTFYVDGVADSLEIPDQEEGDWLVNNTSIGGILRASASHWSTGVLDDVAIWKRALSASEVAELATSSVSDHLGGGGSDDPVAEGLVSHWPLDAIQGTKTPDVVSGYDMDITNLTADDVVPGKNGNAFSFDNARQTLLSRVHDAGDDLPANKHAAHTISMWVNVVGEGQNDLRVFSEGNTENSNPLFNIGTHNGGADGSVDFYIRQSGWPTFGHAYSEQQPFDGTWHHIVWVQEADGSRVLYVDGIADSLEIAPKEEGDWLVNNTSIGGILRASASHWSTGLIDDVAIWKRALSADEVASVGQNGVPSVSGGSNRPPGLVSHWPLDEIQGTKTPDVVSGYDMDISNLTASDVVPGKNGNAFSFDNARQTLLSRVHEADDDLPANKHASHTITMWVNVVGEGQNDLRVFSEGNTENSNPLFNIGTHNGGADGSVDFYLRQSGWTTFGHAYSEQQPFDGSWHHIAWVQDERSRTFYVDGVADSLEIPDQEEGDWLVNNTSIGGILRASASHWSTGLIDDVAIWKRALSADEINNVIQNGVPKVTSGNLRPLGIAAFGAEFTGAAKGDSVVLTWDASADASLSINRGVGEVTAASEFGVGSVEVQVEESTTFTLTASRGNEQVTASVHVTAYDGVADGWSLIENFETMEQSSVNGQLRWKNPVGSTAVIDTGNAAFGQALTLEGQALSAILLGSKTILEGEKATLFFRMYGTEADELGIQANVGLSEKPIRFIGDFDNEVGPFVQMSDIEGFGLDIYAIDGFQGAAEWSGTTVDYDEVYNVWMHVDNRSVEDGDKFTVFIQQVGGERVEAFKDYTSDRNPAGSVDLGLPGPDLDTLFVSSHNGSLVPGQFMVDDFYISRGGFNDTEPHAPGAVTVIPESEEPEPEPEPGAISSIEVSDAGIVINYTGTLKSSSQVTGPYQAVTGASGPAYSVTPDQAQQFYIAE